MSSVGSSTSPVQQGPAAFRPSYDILSSLTSSRPTSQSPSPVPSQPQQHPTATPPPPADPFASLVSAGSRMPSPLSAGAPQTQRPAAASPSLLGLGGASPSPQPAGQTANKGAEDDEWNFTSSLPESNSLPSTNKVQVLNSSLRIDFVARRHPNGAPQIHVVALFSNGTSQPLSELHFQVAVEKVGLLFFFLFLKTLNLLTTSRYSRTHCDSDHSPAGIYCHCSRMEYNRRCYWKVSRQAKATRSKSGSRYPTGLERKLKRSKEWCHRWGFHEMMDSL